MRDSFPASFTQQQRRFSAIATAYSATTFILSYSIFKALDIQLLAQNSGLIAMGIFTAFFEKIKNKAPVEEVVFKKYALKIKMQMAVICSLLCIGILLLKPHNYLAATFLLSLSFFLYSFVLLVVENPNWGFAQNLRMLDLVSSVFLILMLIGVPSGETSLLSPKLILPALALGWIGTTLSVYLQGKALNEADSTADEIHSGTKRLNWLGIKTHLCFAIAAGFLVYASLFRREMDDLLLTAIITLFCYFLCLRHISHMRRDIIA